MTGLRGKTTVCTGWFWGRTPLTSRTISLLPVFSFRMTMPSLTRRTTTAKKEVRTAWKGRKLEPLMTFIVLIVFGFFLLD